MRLPRGIVAAWLHAARPVLCILLAERLATRRRMSKWSGRRRGTEARRMADVRDRKSVV